MKRKSPPGLAITYLCLPPHIKQNHTRKKIIIRIINIIIKQQSIYRVASHLLLLELRLLLRRLALDLHRRVLRLDGLSR
jgi:hypothetical protein